MPKTELKKIMADMPKGVCIVCGSGLLIKNWRVHPSNIRIHCNDCGTEVTTLMHSKKQPTRRRDA